MSKYEPGIWYGWNGGEMPVHPETVVDAVWMSGEPLRSARRDAGSFGWGKPSSIIAFRIVREYREPREWWILPGDSRDYISFHKPLGVDWIHVREVIDGEDQS